MAAVLDAGKLKDAVVVAGTIERVEMAVVGLPVEMKDARDTAHGSSTGAKPRTPCSVSFTGTPSHSTQAWASKPSPSLRTPTRRTEAIPRPARILWTNNPPLPNPSLSILVYGDVTITITEHRTMIEYLGGDLGMSEPRTDAVRGTVSGRLKDDGGPDTPGWIDVHATFAISEAGCYPNRYPNR